MKNYRIPSLLCDFYIAKPNIATHQKSGRA